MYTPKDATPFGAPVGYRSNIEMVIEDTPEGLQQMLTAFALAHPEQSRLLFDPDVCGAKVKDGFFTFDAAGWKWYSRRLVGDILGTDEYEDVEAVETLILFSKNWAQTEAGHQHSGHFLRWGEEDDDTDEIYWTAA